MLDREKVIDALNRCTLQGRHSRKMHQEACAACLYKRDRKCNFTALMKDALELLKEQEPVDPIEMIDDFYPIGEPLRTIGWRCGQCGDRIAGYDNFCPNCGKAVKWDA